MLKEVNPTIQTVRGRVRNPRDQGSTENMQKHVKAVLKLLETEIRQQGGDPNWTSLLGRTMAAINKSSGRLATDVAPYKAVFGMDYDHPIFCSMKDIWACKTIQDRL